MLVTLLLIFVTSAFVQGKTPWNSTWSDKLRSDLLTNYDHLSRPYINNETTRVEIRLSLTHLDIDELKSMFMVNGWFAMFWTDKKMIWKPEDYGGLQEIHFSPKEIWKPDILLYNSADGQHDQSFGGTESIGYSTGSMLWVPPSHFSAYCDLDLRRWPRDEQKCFLKFGSWTHNIHQIDLQLKEGNLTPETEFMTQNSKWELLKIDKVRNEKFYPCCPDAYPDITYTITMRRRSPSFLSLLVLPAAVVVILVLAGFWLPPQAGERVILNALTALIICDLQRAVTQKLPDASGPTPYIMLFYSASLGLATLSLVTSVLVIYIVRNQCRRPLPTPLTQVLTDLVGKVLCVSTVQRPRVRDEKELDGAVNSANTDTSYSTDWTAVARVIDRLAFFICILVFLALGIALI